MPLNFSGSSHEALIDVDDVTTNFKFLGGVGAENNQQTYLLRGK